MRNLEKQWEAVQKELAGAMEERIRQTGLTKEGAEEVRSIFTILTTAEASVAQCTRVAGPMPVLLQLLTTLYIVRPASLTDLYAAGLFILKQSLGDVEEAQPSIDLLH